MFSQSVHGQVTMTRDSGQRSTSIRSLRQPRNWPETAWSIPGFRSSTIGLTKFKSFHCEYMTQLCWKHNFNQEADHLFTSGLAFKG